MRKTYRHSVRRRSIALLLVVAASACASPVTTTPTDEAAGPSATLPRLPPTPPRTPPAATTAALRPCVPNDVSGTFDHWGAAAGSYGGSFRLVPSSGDRCALPEHPVTSLIDERGGRLLFVESWPGAARWVPVRAAAGDDATFFMLLWSSHGGDPGYSCASRTLPLAAVQIDAAGGPMTLEFPVASRPTLCAEPPEHVFVQVVGREP